MLHNSQLLQLVSLWLRATVHGSEYEALSDITVAGAVTSRQGLRNSRISFCSFRKPAQSSRHQLESNYSRRPTGQNQTSNPHLTPSQQYFYWVSETKGGKIIIKFHSASGGFVCSHSLDMRSNAVYLQYRVLIRKTFYPYQLLQLKLPRPCEQPQKHFRAPCFSLPRISVAERPVSIYLPLSTSHCPPLPTSQSPPR